MVTMLIIGGISLALLFAGWWYAVKHAPEGWEDEETGFHYGRQK